MRKNMQRGITRKRDPHCRCSNPKQRHIPKSENPQPRTSKAQLSKPASSSNGYVYRHSKQELKNERNELQRSSEKLLPNQHLVKNSDYLSNPCRRKIGSASFRCIIGLTQLLMTEVPEDVNWNTSRLHLLVFYQYLLNGHHFRICK